MRGAGFAVAGMTLQAILRNPLASPSTLGISQGAAFGAACGIILLSIHDPGVGNQAIMVGRHLYLVSLLAFGTAMATTLCIVLLAGLRQTGREAIILAGVALGAFFMAGTAILQYFADETQLATIVSWTFGDVGRGSWAELRIIAVVVFLGLAYLHWQTPLSGAMIGNGKELFEPGAMDEQNRSRPVCRVAASSNDFRQRLPGEGQATG